MKNKFPYYQIHQIIVDNLGWAASNCLGTSEWEECVANTIEKVNFFIFEHIEDLSKDSPVNYGEEDMNAIWREYKNPKEKKNAK